jgi:FAD/FMN-containing dehydrogenase
MTTVLEATQMAAASALDDSLVTKLRNELRGDLLRPGDPHYDSARAVWNGMIDRRPGLIARCAGVADVIRCVKLARDHELVLAVRGGGHNISGNAVCDGGLMIDLSGMRAVRVDPRAQTVRAEGGALWGDVDHETQLFGLATPGGFVSTTGVAGLTLGGGIAWLMGQYGLACDNLLSADVVTADGRLLTASPAEHEDLFWGLRGGGGNFGVVTSLEFELHHLGPTVLAGLLAWPVSRARDVHAAFQELIASAPDELIALAALLNLPELGPSVALGVCYSGKISDGENVLRPLRRLGPPAADQIAPMPYIQAQRLFDPMYPKGRRTYWKSNFLQSMDSAVVDTMTEYFRTAPSPLAHSFLEGFNGAVRRVPSESTAFAQRNADYNFTLITLWTDPAEDALHMRWGRDYWQAMQPFSTGGVYVNYLGATAEEGEERIRAAYGATKYARLAALKKKYDPTNLFRLNHNIPPA